ncbi:MAG: hypothetical protein ACSLE4_12915, partial [Methyloceanibacter sp.]|uniref:hypothetical protein n=1 Tax=Methyloceanibacter sp. TaxID=1965321 RepID=UPI003EE0C687
GPVAHQRLRADPAHRLVAGLERNSRQRRHHLEIALEPLANRLSEPIPLKKSFWKVTPAWL